MLTLQHAKEILKLVSEVFDDIDSSESASVHNKFSLPYMDYMAYFDEEDEFTRYKNHPAAQN